MKRAFAMLSGITLVVTAWMGTVTPKAQAIPAFKAVVSEGRGGEPGSVPAVGKR